MTAYSLGPLPWSNETLERAYFRGFAEAYEAIRQHPGYELHRRVQSLQSALRLFCKWCSHFLDELEKFHIEAHEGKTLEKRHALDLKGFEDSFQEALYIVASTAMTLVDQSRGIKNHLDQTEYQSRAELFANDPAHRLIQELRNDVIHVSLHKPNWRRSYKEDGNSSTEMILLPHQLSRSSEWHQLARKYLQAQPDGIAIGQLIKEYQVKVNAFHEWLHTALQASVGNTIADYLRCERHLKTIGSRSMWRLMLLQVVIPQKRDPYSYLDRYLTPEELAEVSRLPSRSKTQVDRIIELVDEYGACDEELRGLVYQAFQVNDYNQ
jgi:hypothetical protein